MAFGSPALLTNDQCDRIEVVLVSPRNPLNIGAAARAMANFGFARLSVVAPYEPHWREAKSAVGADELLQNARITERLADALADCTLVVGTGSLEHRKPEQSVVPLPDLALVLRKELARGGRIALVFGSEKRGLTREDLALCHLLTEIPTDPRQPSMNLGQAVAVCLYEISSRINQTAAAAADRGPVGKKTGSDQPAAISDEADQAVPASTRDLELLAGAVEETLLAANYSPAAMRKANRHDLDLLLRRLSLARRDAVRILGLFRRILWRLNRNPARKSREQRDVTGK
jgi:TrmH family RNA methyltransferase